MRRAVVYARVSRDSTGEGRSVERQLEACRKLCDLRGWKIVGELSDNSISAYTDKHRPGWERALEMARGGQLDVLVVWHIDRATRSMVELERLILLAEDHGVGVATATGDIDLTTDVGRMVARILAAVARAEVERRVARQKEANKQRAAKGEPHLSGPRPIGYAEDRVTIVAKEADAIRDGARRILAGGSLAAVAQDWTERGLKDAGWTAPGVRFVLTSPRYAGIRTLNGIEIGPAVWPPILDHEVYLALKAALPDPRLKVGNGKRGPRPTSLLSGIARCAVCDEPVRASSRKDKLTYSCRVGRHTNTPREDADLWVEAAVVEFLSHPNIASHLWVDDDADELAEARDRQVELRQRLDYFAKGFASGALTQSEYETGSATVRELLAEVEATLATATRDHALDDVPDVGTPHFGSTWAVLDLETRRALVERLTESIVLHPQGRGRKRPHIRELVDVTMHGGIRAKAPDGPEMTP